MYIHNTMYTNMYILRACVRASRARCYRNEGRTQKQPTLDIGPPPKLPLDASIRRAGLGCWQPSCIWVCARKCHRVCGDGGGMSSIVWVHAHVSLYSMITQRVLASTEYGFAGKAPRAQRWSTFSHRIRAHRTHQSGCPSQPRVGASGPEQCQ